VFVFERQPSVAKAAYFLNRNTSLLQAGRFPTHLGILPTRMPARRSERPRGRLRTVRSSPSGIRAYGQV